MTTIEEPKTVDPSPYLSPGSSVPDNEFEYQSISKAAVASCVFAVLGITAFLSQVFVILPILGLGFGILGLISINRYPEELTGRLVAKIGMVVSLLFLVSSIGMHSYIYATEVPDGYTRVTFWELRNNKRVTSIPFSESAYDLDGKKVFLKGYIRPVEGKKNDLKKFILVGDLGECCFGQNPDTDQVVACEIITDEAIDHTYFMVRIGGTFRLTPATKPVNEDGVPVVYYSIEADYIH